MKSLWNPTIRGLFQKQLKDGIEKNSIKDGDTVDARWEKPKENIIEAAIESLGIRKIAL